jgi:hypothetical protein
VARKKAFKSSRGILAGLQTTPFGRLT